MKISNTPLVTIMIPVYNRESLIKETLLSALNQDFEDYEVVVVDNKSTDNTYEILKDYTQKYTNLRIFQNSRNLGPVLNWKVGIENSRGRYLKILWSDDQIDSNFLKETVPILEKDEEIGFVYTSTILRLGSSEHIEYIWGNSGKYFSRDFITAHYIGGKSVPLSPGNALFRTKDIKESFIIDIKNPKNLDFKRYGAGNDLLMYLITASRYKYFHFIKENFSIFKVHDGSFSITNDIQEYYLISKVYFLNEVPDSIRKKDFDKFFTKLFCHKNYKYLSKEVDFNINAFQFIKEIWIYLRRMK